MSGRLMQMAYRDSPQPIGYNATISAPHMHATCVELLVHHLTPGSKVAQPANLISHLFLLSNLTGICLE